MPLGQPSEEGLGVVRYLTGSSEERRGLRLSLGNMGAWMVMKALPNHSFIYSMHFYYSSMRGRSRGQQNLFLQECPGSL